MDIKTFAKQLYAIIDYDMAKNSLLEAAADLIREIKKKTFSDGFDIELMESSAKKIDGFTTEIRQMTAHISQDRDTMEHNTKERKAIFNTYR